MERGFFRFPFFRFLPGPWVNGWKPAAVARCNLARRVPVETRLIGFHTKTGGTPSRSAANLFPL